MNVLAKMLFLFQILLIFMTPVAFKPWQKDISKFTWQGKKQELTINCARSLKKKKGEFTRFKIVLRGVLFYLNERMSNYKNLEGHELRFGWHPYLWYGKIKI